MMAEEELFDLLVPPGVPRKMIYDVVENYDVEVVRRPQKLAFANMDGDERTAGIPRQTGRLSKRCRLTFSRGKSLSASNPFLNASSPGRRLIGLPALFISMLHATGRFTLWCRS